MKDAHGATGFLPSPFDASPALPFLPFLRELPLVNDCLVTIGDRLWFQNPHRRTGQLPTAISSRCQKRAPRENIEGHLVAIAGTSRAGFRAGDEQHGSYCGPEVGFEEVEPHGLQNSETLSHALSHW